MMTSSPIRWTALAALSIVLMPGLVRAIQAPAAAAAAVQKAPTAKAPSVTSIRETVDEQQRQLKNQLALTSEKNKREGEAFLTANKTREGVVTLPSGLQYKILKAGEGKTPTIEDTVVCHFVGGLIDGTEFANSYASTQSAAFPVKRAIKGWAEALQLMPVGSRWQLFIPPGLANGARGVGSRIGPDAALILEVELLSIKEAGEKPAAPDNKAAGVVGPGASHKAPANAITVSFRLDLRLTQGLYMGERWVAPPKYNQAGTGKTLTVQARAHGRDEKGATRDIRPTWIPADPEMVTVTPGAGNAVTITVLRAGRSSVNVVAGGVSKELAIHASYHGQSMQVEIAQQ
jgi:FKBP-type peptidyl-prolyl cis-trans isomerase FklB